LEKTTNWRDEKWLNTILPLIPKFCTIFFKRVKDEGMTKLLESVLNQVLQHKLPSRLKLSHMKGLKKEKIIVMVITRED